MLSALVFGLGYVTALYKLSLLLLLLFIAHCESALEVYKVHIRRLTSGLGIIINFIYYYYYYYYYYSLISPWITPRFQDSSGLTLYFSKARDDRCFRIKFGTPSTNNISF